jgi:DtxR family Mn-dependent transcriptional regulator
VPTIPTENYLIAIQTLHDDEVRCIPARIAEVVGVSPPTVTEALKRLARDEYIEPAHDPEVQLTDKGRTLVFELIRRHRIVERWLTDVLGLDWAAAHEEAHHLEHAMSETVAERLWASMGCPAGCPHGNPIPPPGEIPAHDRTHVRLRDVPAGVPVTLARISELAEDIPDVMHYFHEKGFRPNAVIVVVDRAPLNGPLTVEVDGQPVALSEDLAAYIWVRPTEAPAAEHADVRELAAGRA